MKFDLTKKNGIEQSRDCMRKEVTLNRAININRYD